MEKLFRCLMMQLFCAINIHAQVIINGDLAINEILFNPVKDGYDYVEVYNKSNHAINVSELLIANRNAVNEIASVKAVSKESLTIMPGRYFVMTANEKWLKLHYKVPDSALIIQMPSLPTFADDKGNVVLLRKSDSAIVDELSYNENWHFKMISDPQGVALERINYSLATQDKNNWTSASTSSGSGTPGYTNSQFLSSNEVMEDISIQPAVFSPDNDGENDFASISVRTVQPGKVINAAIFNAVGRRVRYLLKNEILGVNNRFIWDGYDDRDQLLPSGIYILFIQIFDTNGTVTRRRNCIVLNSFPP
jgi:hypothetical protein